MTRYEELRAEIEAATTKGELAEVKNGIVAAHNFRAIRDSEADELWAEVERRLRKKH